MEKMLYLILFIVRIFCCLLCSHHRKMYEDSLLSVCIPAAHINAFSVDRNQCCGTGTGTEIG